MSAGTGPAPGVKTVPPALRRVIPLLRCPICGQGVAVSDSGVRCGSGHSFDRARQGYLTMLGGRGRRFPGDSSEQVAARERVLGSGLFDSVTAAVAEAAVAALTDVRDPVVVDAGAGTGFYLARVLDALADSPRTGSPTGIGTEISAPAARRLARAHPRAAALVADTWAGLPLADRSVDAIQVIFAPRNVSEFTRVLAPGGALVVAVPGPAHLEPLRIEAGMLTPAAGKPAQLEESLDGAFVQEHLGVADHTTSIPAELALDLALMGPSGVHLDRESLAGGLGSGDRSVRVQVEVRTYRRTS